MQALVHASANLLAGRASSFKGDSPRRSAAALSFRPCAALLCVVAGFLLSGCSSASDLRVLSYSDRFSVSEQGTFAVLSAHTEHDAYWGFGDPASIDSELGSLYRPADTPQEFGPAADAPPPTDALLARTRAEFEARGYRLVSPEAKPDVVVALSHTTDEGRTQRLGLHLGGSVQGLYKPDWISVAAEADPEDNPDPIELLLKLLEVVPSRGKTSE